VAEDFIADNSSKVKSNFVPSESRRAEYQRTYDRLMGRAKGRVKVKGEHENHHIVPKSLGGSNEKSNIVALTYREHFLAHWLLTKFTEGKARISMLKALSEMRRAGRNNKNRVISGWQYAVARRARSEAMTLWHKTPEASVAYTKIGLGIRARDATPEGVVSRKKQGETRRARDATPEGQEERKSTGRKSGETLRIFYSTPEGQETLRQAGRKRSKIFRVRDATPEGKVARKRAGKKISETIKSRGSLAGENHPCAKVTEDIVRAIRALPLTAKEIAAYFGCSTQIVYSIRTGKTWRHVK
jgi:hypothetical protein